MPPDARRNLWQLKRKLGKSREYLYERAYAGGIPIYIYARGWAGVGGQAGCPVRLSVFTLLWREDVHRKTVYRMQ